MDLVTRELFDYALAEIKSTAADLRTIAHNGVKFMPHKDVHASVAYANEHVKTAQRYVEQLGAMTLIDKSPALVLEHIDSMGDIFIETTELNLAFAVVRDMFAEHVALEKANLAILNAQISSLIATK